MYVYKKYNPRTGSLRHFMLKVFCASLKPAPFSVNSSTINELVWVKNLIFSHVHHCHAAVLVLWRSCGWESGWGLDSLYWCKHYIIPIQMFKLFDEDGNGNISIQELLSMMAFFIEVIILEFFKTSRSNLGSYCIYYKVSKRAFTETWEWEKDSML